MSDGDSEEVPTESTLSASTGAASSTSPAAVDAIHGEEEVGDVLLADFYARVEDQLLRQLQFYFSETNLLRDRWLRKQFEDGEGWVDIKVIGGESHSSVQLLLA